MDLTLDAILEDFNRERMNRKPVYKNTIKAKNRDVKQFQDFLGRLMVVMPIEELSPQDMNTYLAKYFLATFKNNGSTYEPDNLTAKLYSIDCYLAAAQYGYSLRCDPQFKQARDCLKAKKVQSKEEGKGNGPNKAAGLSEADETKLREAQVLGADTPFSLQFSIWYMITSITGLWGQDEHRNLTWQDLTIKLDNNGMEYLDMCLATTRDGTNNNVQNMSSKYYCVCERESDDCLIKWLQIFFSKRPRKCFMHGYPLYLTPMPTTHHQSSDTIWYYQTPLGVNKIGSLLSDACTLAGIEKRTNCDVQKSEVRYIRKADVDNKIIGHTPVHTLNVLDAKLFDQDHLDIQAVIMGQHIHVDSKVRSSTGPWLIDQASDSISEEDCDIVQEGKPVKNWDEDLKKFRSENKKPDKKHTIAATKRDVKQFKDFLENCMVVVPMEQLSPQDLNIHLSKFFMEAVKKDGSTYEASSLIAKLYSIDRYLDSVEYGHSLRSDLQFKLARDSLRAKILQSKEDGNRSNKVDRFTETDETKLRQPGALGPDTPFSLQFSIWYTLSMSMGIWGREKHRKLTWDDLTIKVDSNGKEYLHISKFGSRTRDTTNDNIQITPSRYYCVCEGDRCLVEWLKKFFSKRPQQCCVPGYPLYLTPIPASRHKSADKTWYYTTPMGRNKIGSLLADACTIAGIKRRANSRMRKAVNTHKLKAQEVDGKMPGHISVCTLNNSDTEIPDTRPVINQHLPVHGSLTSTNPQLTDSIVTAPSLETALTSDALPISADIEVSNSISKKHSDMEQLEEKPLQKSDEAANKFINDYKKVDNQNTITETREDRQMVVVPIKENSQQDINMAMAEQEDSIATSSTGPRLTEPTSTMAIAWDMLDNINRDTEYGNIDQDNDFDIVKMEEESPRESVDGRPRSLTGLWPIDPTPTGPTVTTQAPTNILAISDEIEASDSISEEDCDIVQELKPVKNWDEDVKKFINENKNPDKKHTIRATKRDVKQFKDFLETCMVVVPMEELSPQDLNKHLSKFFMEAVKKDGSTYEPNSLMAKLYSIDRYLSSVEYGHSLRSDLQFELARDSLKAKTLQSKEDGNHQNKVDRFTEADETKLQQAGALGPDTPFSLQFSIWYTLSISMGLYGREQHRKLTWDDLIIKVDSYGKEYLHLSKFVARTRDSTNDNTQITPSRYYCVCEGEGEKCLLEWLKKFSSKRPQQCCVPGYPLYLTAIPVSRHKSADMTWYYTRPMGKNKIGTLLADACTIAGIERRANSCIRKTAITCMWKAEEVDGKIPRHISVCTLNNSDIEISDTRPVISQHLSVHGNVTSLTTPQLTDSTMTAPSLEADLTSDVLPISPDIEVSNSVSEDHSDMEQLEERPIKKSDEAAKKFINENKKIDNQNTITETKEETHMLVVPIYESSQQDIGKAMAEQENSTATSSTGPWLKELTRTMVTAGDMTGNINTGTHDDNLDQDGNFDMEQMEEDSPGDSDGDVKKTISEMINKHTIKATNRDVKQFQDFLGTLMVVAPIEKLSPHDMNKFLAKYFMAAVKQDGSPYEPGSLTAKLYSIDRFLASVEYGYNLRTDPQFKLARESLRAKKVQCKKKGMGNMQKKAAGLSEEDETLLRKTGVLGTENPFSLQFSIWYMLTVAMGIYGRERHRKLTWDNLIIQVDSNGKEYLDLFTYAVKTSDDTDNNVQKISSRYNCVCESKSDQCLIEWLKKFWSKRPEGSCVPGAPLYLTPIPIERHSSTSTIWYYSSPLGRNKIGTLLPNACAMAGIKKRTNYGVRRMAKKWMNKSVMLGSNITGRAPVSTLTCSNANPCNSEHVPILSFITGREQLSPAQRSAPSLTRPLLLDPFLKASMVIAEDKQSNTLGISQVIEDSDNDSSDSFDIEFLEEMPIEKGDQDVKMFMDENMKPNKEHTITATKQDVDQFKDFLETLMVLTPIEDLSPHDLDRYLVKYFTEAVKKDGAAYEPASLTAKLCSIDCYLDSVKYMYSLRFDPQFKHTRDSLRADQIERMTEKGNKPPKGAGFSKEDGSIQSLTGPWPIEQTGAVTTAGDLTTNAMAIFRDIEAGNLEPEDDLDVEQYITFQIPGLGEL